MGLDRCFRLQMQRLASLAPTSPPAQEEDAFLEGSDFEGISESESEAESDSEDDWQPAGGRRKPAGGAAASKRSKH